jgi:hypothetical protein
VGYTHYFSFHKPARGRKVEAQKAYAKAVLECSKIVKHYSAKHGGLSGFTAHAPRGVYGGLGVNGSENSGSCEDFVLREHFMDYFNTDNEQSSFDFVKTRQYPYDTVVTACLIVLKYRMKDLIGVSSDGDASDWEEGLALAQEVTGLKSLKIPIKSNIEEMVR